MSMIRSSLSSPTARFASKAILTRPAALPLSPGAFPYAASFSINVHTPTSPKLNISNIPRSPYDRSFASTTEAFRALQSPSAFRSFSDIQIVQSPVVALETAPVLLIQNAPKPRSKAALRFQETLAARTDKKVLPRAAGLDSSLSRFPRSPYPTGQHVSAVRDMPLSAIEEEQLNKDFWKSVKLEGEVENTKGVEMMFGDRNGGLWSPSLPRAKEIMRDAMTDMRSPSFPVTPFSATGNGFGFGMPLSPLPRARLADVPLNVMSPTVTQFGMMKSSTGKALKSPAINDPFAVFPSFSAVLMMDGAKTNTAAAL